MAIVDRIIEATGQLARNADPEARLTSPLSWLRKATSYTAINRVVGLAIPFTTRNGFRVEELRPGYVKARVSLKGNKNHFGSLYAGAFFLVAEVPGGVLSLFDLGPAYTPILRDMKLTFLQPANTDVTVAFSLTQQELDQIRADADANGKAYFNLHGELFDDNGQRVATSEASYTVRKKGFKPR
ncbi:MAG: DUF4442 domain-containing protein [Marinobacter sp.]|nr:DUF4442 domain-containing protein [Marinobacter sp.]